MNPNSEEHDSLWKLLGRAHRPVLPRSFAQDVMHAISHLESGLSEAVDSAERSKGRRFHRIVTWFASGAVAAALLIVSMNFSTHSSLSEEDAILAAIADQGFSSGDVALLAHLDEVIDAELASLWTDAP